jgi:ArsR family transcriptional regulator
MVIDGAVRVGTGSRLRCGCASHAGAVDLDALRGTADLLNVLGAPIRLGIVELLSRHDRLCVCDIAEAFPVGQPTISHHLRLLREAGVVDCVRAGHWAYYRVRRDALKRAAQEMLRFL